MIIDDSDLDCLIAHKVLVNMCFARNIILIKSAREGLAYLNNGSNKNELPEVIFLDINMPVMDGFGFLAAYSKCCASIKEQIKIVVLSSSDSSCDRKLMEKDPNVIQYLLKPMQPKHLWSIIQQVNHKKKI